jgi:hypothetical protein
MKRVISKGKGVDSLKETDEAILSVILLAKKSQKVILAINSSEGQIAYSLLPKSIGDLILYLKESEDCKIDIKK